MFIVISRERGQISMGQEKIVVSCKFSQSFGEDSQHNNQTLECLKGTVQSTQSGLRIWLQSQANPLPPNSPRDFPSRKNRKLHNPHCNSSVARTTGAEQQWPSSLLPGFPSHPSPQWWMQPQAPNWRWLSPNTMKAIAWNGDLMVVFLEPPEVLCSWGDILGDDWPILIYLDTSSTAQGGGGSFKNRTPIGEVGCWESRMAERIHWWTERWLELCFLDWLLSLQWSPGRSTSPTTAGCNVV